MIGVCLILAVLVEAVAVVWTVISFFACFCKQHILHPLSGFAVFAFLLLLSISLVYYFVYTKELPHDIRRKMRLQDISELQFQTKENCRPCRISGTATTCALAPWR